MKRLVMSVLVGVLLVTALTIAPAKAGDGYWSPSGCNNGRLANEGYWYGVPGQGSHYYSNVWGGPFWVGGQWYQFFRKSGFECGNLGWPANNVYDVCNVSPLYYCGTWLKQDFAGGSINLYQGLWYFCTHDGYCYRVYP